MSWKDIVIYKIESENNLVDYTRLFGNEYFPYDEIKNWEKIVSGTSLEQYCKKLENLPNEFASDRALPIIDMYCELTELRNLDAQTDIEFILNKCVNLPIVKSKLIELHDENRGSLTRKENFKNQIKTLFVGIIVALTNYLNTNFGLTIRYCELAKKGMNSEHDNLDFRELYKECLINLQNVVLKGSSEILCAFLKFKPRNSEEFSEYVFYKLKLHKLIENARNKLWPEKNKKLSIRSVSMSSLIDIVPASFAGKKYASNENIPVGWQDHAEILLNDLEKNLMSKGSLVSLYLQLEIFSNNVKMKKINFVPQEIKIFDRIFLELMVEVETLSKNKRFKNRVSTSSESILLYDYN